MRVPLLAVLRLPWIGYRSSTGGGLAYGTLRKAQAFVMCRVAWVRVSAQFVIPDMSAVDAFTGREAGNDQVPRSHADEVVRPPDRPTWSCSDRSSGLKTTAPLSTSARANQRTP